MSVGLEALTSICLAGSLASFQEVNESLFVTDEEQEVYQFIRRHFRRYKELPSVPIVQEATGVELEDAESTTDYYLDQLYDRLLYNSLRQPYHELRTAMSSADAGAIQEAVASLNRAHRGSQRTASSSLSDIASVGDRLIDLYQERQLALGLTGIDTGWPYLNDLSGGYQNGDFISIVARTSVGKTWILLHSAYVAYLSGASVLIVSTEMTKEQIANRLIAIHAQVDPSLVRKGRLCYWSRQRFFRAVTDFSDPHRLKIYAGNIGRSTEDIDACITQHSPDLILIDGFYLLKPTTAGRSSGRFEKVYYVTDEIRNMSLAHNRPIAVTTQFNRQAGDRGREGSIETIAYADAIATHSSLLISAKAHDRADRRTLELMKGREGEAGKWNIHYEFKPPSFMQADDEEDESQSVDLDWME